MRLNNTAISNQWDLTWKRPNLVVWVSVCRIISFWLKIRYSWQIVQSQSFSSASNLKLQYSENQSFNRTYSNRYFLQQRNDRETSTEFKWDETISEAYPTLLAQASALQSVAIQAVDWQQSKSTAIFTNIFFFSNSCSNQKSILQKLMGAPKNLGVITFPDPVSHFEAPCCCHFGFLRFL